MLRNRLQIPSKPSLCAALALVAALLASAIDSRAQEEGTSLGAFEDLYARVQEAVDEGNLPASARAEAEDLRFALQKDLIRHDAEIEVLKLEAARYRDEEQQHALDRLVAAAAARERRVIEHVRSLERLAGMSVDLSQPPPPAAEEETSAAAEKAEDKKGGFEITFKAQDLIEDPDP